jgi:SAM-dependent methyltransferase
VSWQEFWNGNTTIYVNERHKEVHYRRVAEDIVAHIERPAARVLDFGCGEALSGNVVAAACSQLFLCDAAETVRDRIKTRMRDVSNLRVLSPEAVSAMPDGAFDVIVANSVIQYLSRPDLETWLATWRRVLSPRGKLVLGDIVPRGVGPLVDAAALLKFANKHGFLVAAAGGLVRTALSDYRRKRAQYGLLQLDETEIVALARAAGFDAGRHSHNLGHNPSRLTIVATPVAGAVGQGTPAADIRIPRYEMREAAAPLAKPPLS